MSGFTSLRRIVSANALSQLHGTLLAVAFIPVCLHAMGPEAFGLIGFSSTLAVWFNLLDFGLTSSFSREAARYHGGALDLGALHQIFRTLELVFTAIGLLGCVCLVVGAGAISSHWLDVRHLGLADVEFAIMLMGLSMPFRWAASLYRAALVGLERQVWLAGFNIVTGSARFVCVFPLFAIAGTKPQTFFGYQLVWGILDAMALYVVSRRALGPSKLALGSGALREIRRMVPFSLNLAFSSIVWLLVTQSDRLLLSKLLPLREYGYFTVAVTIAGGVTSLVAPLSQALVPRFARLAATNENAALLELYRRGTQLVCALAAPTSLMAAAFASPVIWVWTGDDGTADAAARIVALYVLGNGIIAVGGFPYLLQYARGDLRLHAIGNVIILGLFVPSLAWATLHYGAVGAGSAWVAVNGAYFLFWIPVVHRRFIPGMQLRWLFTDVIPIVAAAAAGTLAVVFAFDATGLPHERIRLGLVLFSAGIFPLACGALASSAVRGFLRGARSTWKRGSRSGGRAD